MADSTAIFTVEDPLQGVPTTDQTFNVEDPLLCTSQLTLNNFDDDRQPGEELDDLLETEDLLLDPVIWQLCNGNSDEPDFLQPDDFSCPENRVSEDHSMALSVVSIPPSQYSCACCQVLREITHTNGMSVKRLEIHGAFGIITHALLGIYDYGLSFQPQDCQMFDFDKESTQMVKKFLVQYYEICRLEGYSPMQDPLSTFYEALSVGFNEPVNTNNFLQLSPEITGDCQLNQPGRGTNQFGLMKIPLAMQRERTRNLGLKDFADYFDCPIEDAARKLNICPTVLKKICRKHGVLRWPYRKIKSIERKISKSKKILDASTDEERGRVLEDIQKYKQQLANIYAEFSN